MAMWLTLGTVNVTLGSTTVTGVGTSFSQAKIGSEFMLRTGAPPDGGPVTGPPYEITAVASDLSMTIFPAYGGTTATNQAYAIRPITFSMEKDLIDRIDGILTRIDGMMFVAGNDKIINLDKPVITANAIARYRTAGVDKWRHGTAGDDAWKLQRWSGSLWETAFSFPATGSLVLNEYAPKADPVFTGVVRVTTSLPQSSAVLAARGATTQNTFEWGSANTAGFGSTIGHFVGSGDSFIGFSIEGGTNTDTFRTRGRQGFAIHGSGTFIRVVTVALANADNQAPVSLFSITNAGLATALALDVTGTTRRPGQPAFSAWKNGVAQGGIPPGAFTLVTFPTEIFDTGNFFNAATGKWTPPAGRILLCASAYVSSGLTAGTIILSVFKNNVRFKDTLQRTATADFGINIAIIDDANGTDTYEIRIFGNTASTYTVDGTTATYFMGYML
jgi:hypothetical protein